MIFTPFDSLIDQERLNVLTSKAAECQFLPGHVIEVGVYKGGSLTRIANVFKQSQKVIFGIDTFMGMPKPNKDYDLHKEGDFKDTDYEFLKGWYEKNFPKVILIKGKFPDVADQLPESGKYCFIHIDVDIYTSVRDCCHYFYPQLINQGVMIFDDYLFPTTPGAKRAVDEYFYNLNGGYIGKVLETKQYLVTKTGL